MHDEVAVIEEQGVQTDREHDRDEEQKEQMELAHTIQFTLRKICLCERSRVRALAIDFSPLTFQNCMKY